jgi:tight adherence protein C
VIVVLVAALVLASAWPQRPRGRTTNLLASPSHSPGSSRRIVLTGAAGAVMLVVLGPLALAAIPIGLWWRRWNVVSATSRRNRRLAEDLPDVIDLFGVCASAGLTVPQSVAAVVAHSSGPLTDSLASAVEQTHLGTRLTDALHNEAEHLPDTARALVAVLVAAERNGAPLMATLAGMEDEARRERRRFGEIRARRLPVLMLLPLTTCVLPAFALLTVVPTILVSFASIGRVATP